MTCLVMLKHEAEVGLNNRVPLLEAHAVQRRVARDAGIVDQNFDRPERRLDRLHPVRAGGEIADVELEHRDAGIILELLCGPVVAGVDRSDRDSRRP